MAAPHPHVSTAIGGHHQHHRHRSGSSASKPELVWTTDVLKTVRRLCWLEMHKFAFARWQAKIEDGIAGIGRNGAFKLCRTLSINNRLVDLLDFCKTTENLKKIFESYISPFLTCVFLETAAVL